MSLKRVVILFSGEGSNMEVLIQKLHNKSVNIVKTITNNPKAKGIEKSKSHDIDVLVLDHKEFESREDYDKALVKEILDLEVDLVVLAGFMRILTPIFTSHIKAINIHPSLLPKYKGANALKRSYESGDNIAGVTTHFVNDEIDAGEIIEQISFDKSGASFEEFKQKIHKFEHKIYATSVMKALEI